MVDELAIEIGPAVVIGRVVDEPPRAVPEWAVSALAISFCTKVHEASRLKELPPEPVGVLEPEMEEPEVPGVLYTSFIVLRGELELTKTRVD